MTRVCDPICDFCRHYAFNANAEGAYTGDGRCEHPDHPAPKNPEDWCRDFDCALCTRAREIDRLEDIIVRASRLAESERAGMTQQVLQELRRPC